MFLCFPDWCGALSGHCSALHSGTAQAPGRSYILECSKADGTQMQAREGLKSVRTCLLGLSYFKGWNQTLLPCQLGASGRRQEGTACECFLLHQESLARALHPCGPTERAGRGAGTCQSQAIPVIPKMCFASTLSNLVGKTEWNASKPKGVLATIFTRLPQQLAKE